MEISWKYSGIFGKTLVHVVNAMPETYYYFWGSHLPPRSGKFGDGLVLGLPCFNRRERIELDFPSLKTLETDPEMTSLIGKMTKHWIDLFSD